MLSTNVLLKSFYRLKGCLGFSVSSNQTAFIKGRNISKNVLLAYELVVGYHKNNSLSRCAIKADLRKAYVFCHFVTIYPDVFDSCCLPN